MNELAPDNEIVARNFEIKFRFDQIRLWKFDSGSSIGKIDDKAGYTPPVIQNHGGGLEYGPSSKLTPI